MAANPGYCAACGFAGEVHEHHLVPPSQGGAALPTVFLCAPCHGAVHSRVLQGYHLALAKAGIAAAKARGVKFGNPRIAEARAVANAAAKAGADAFAARVAPAIRAAQGAGAKTLRQIADALNARGIATATGKGQWRATTVLNVLRRLDQRPAA